MKIITQSRRRHRFSLIELMIVLIIMSLLAALVGPEALKKLKKAKSQTAKLQIELLSSAVEDYYLDMDTYPAKLQDLVENSGNEKWDGPYLKKGKLPLDPWNEDYHYTYPGQHGDFDISSYGADKSPGGSNEAADVNSWED
jgi:general secretion pathway protein G